MSYKNTYIVQFTGGNSGELRKFETIALSPKDAVKEFRSHHAKAEIINVCSLCLHNISPKHWSEALTAD